jgi:hypothetical protein
MARGGVTISRGKQPTEALCESCEDLPKGATRERVRLHAEVRGHVAHVVIRDITTYYPPETRHA